jgi:hypothetical protein
MSRLVIQEHFGDEVISAQKLQANFDQCKVALNGLDRHNFDDDALTNECLLAPIVPSMVTYEPSHGRDISWVGLKRLGWVTYGDWELNKVAVWCSANVSDSTIQLVTTEPNEGHSVQTNFTRIGPKLTPSSDKATYSAVYGVTLQKDQALWYEHLLSDGTEGVAGDYTQGPISELRISLYFHMPLRRS